MHVPLSENLVSFDLSNHWAAVLLQWACVMCSLLQSQAACSLKFKVDQQSVTVTAV